MSVEAHPDASRGRRSRGARVPSARRSGACAAHRRAAGLPSAGLDGRAASARRLRDARLPGRRPAAVGQLDPGDHLASPRIDSEGTSRRRPSCSRLIRRCCGTAGFSTRKGETLRALAERFVDGRLSDEALSRMTDDEVEATLTEVRGIGLWTARGFLLVALDRPDVFLSGDLALRRAIQRAYGFDHLPTDDEMARGVGSLAAVSEPRGELPVRVRIRGSLRTRDAIRRDHRRRPARAGDGADRARAGRPLVVIANSRGPESLASVVSALGEGVSAGTVEEAAAPASSSSRCPWDRVPQPSGPRMERPDRDRRDQ